MKPQIATAPRPSVAKTISAARSKRRIFVLRSQVYPLGPFLGDEVTRKDIAANANRADASLMKAPIRHDA
jgi:hypothetical protein